MSFPIRCLQKLLYEIQKWPGVGPKSAQKLVVHLLKKPEDILTLQEALEKVTQNIQKCRQCFGWSENSNICSICQNSSRDSSSLLVVENPFDVFRIESSHIFQGYYHVLHGMISPLQNISPEDLTISSLLKRLNNSLIKEVILALDTNLEGETTALYLFNKLRSFDIKVSKLASGIPLGSHLDFIDDRTLVQAIEKRVEF